jgi:hypothetical protein
MGTQQRGPGQRDQFESEKSRQVTLFIFFGGGVGGNEGSLPEGNVSCEGENAGRGTFKTYCKYLCKYHNVSPQNNK